MLYPSLPAINMRALTDSGERVKTEVAGFIGLF